MAQITFFGYWSLNQDDPPSSISESDAGNKLQVFTFTCFGFAFGVLGRGYFEYDKNVNHWSQREDYSRTLEQWLQMNLISLRQCLSAMRFYCASLQKINSFPILCISVNMVTSFNQHQQTMKKVTLYDPRLSLKRYWSFILLKHSCHHIRKPWLNFRMMGPCGKKVTADSNTKVSDYK